MISQATSVQISENAGYRVRTLDVPNSGSSVRLSSTKRSETIATRRRPVNPHTEGLPDARGRHPPGHIHSPLKLKPSMRLRQPLNMFLISNKKSWIYRHIIISLFVSMWLSYKLVPYDVLARIYSAALYQTQAPSQIPKRFLQWIISSRWEQDYN